MRKIQATAVNFNTTLYLILKQIIMKKKIFSYLALASILPTMTMQANESDFRISEQDSLSTKKADGSERNVMLNAADATKPREIQIGLPSEDVNVYENGLPAVY